MQAAGMNRAVGNQKAAEYHMQRAKAHQEQSNGNSKTTSPADFKAAGDKAMAVKRGMEMHANPNVAVGYTKPPMPPMHKEAMQAQNAKDAAGMTAHANHMSNTANGVEGHYAAAKAHDDAASIHRQLGNGAKAVIHSNAAEQHRTIGRNLSDLANNRPVSSPHSYPGTLPHASVGHGGGSVQDSKGGQPGFDKFGHAKGSEASKNAKVASRAADYGKHASTEATRASDKANKTDKSKDHHHAARLNREAAEKNAGTSLGDFHTRSAEEHSKTAKAMDEKAIWGHVSPSVKRHNANLSIRHTFKGKN